MIESNRMKREVINLINRRQLLTVASVAGAFFLLGSIFVGGLIAMGKGKDKDEDLWNAISELQARVETLEEQSQPQGFITAPAYDSGWISIPQGDTIIFHGLGTTEVLVNLVGYDTETWGIHHLAYGTDSYQHWGAHWSALNEDSIRIYRAIVGPGDPYWDQVRVQIWKISEPPD